MSAPTAPRPGPVCWGCDPSRIAALARRLLRLQPAQHDCQSWIRYATTATACSCPCRQPNPGYRINPITGSSYRTSIPGAREPEIGSFRPGRGCGR